LVIADAHLGLGQAVRAVFLGAGIQRCRVHFMRSRTAHCWDGGALSGACGGRAEPAVAVELLTEREIFTVEPSRTTDGVWHFMVTDSGKAKALAVMQALGY
jgi:hypothetical protein